jgi:uncharacterized protein YcbK (DUF882 family)
MRENSSDVGHRLSLQKRFKKALASAALIAALSAGAWAGFGDYSEAGGETRTLSLYHVHTKESITVTYMVNGRYVPSAIKKINYLMRDWRRNEVIKIDPKTIDLMWELHADLGSHRPIHIICGYRSPRTNSFLKKIGRNVAKKSQHMVGKAIDLYFPDVPTVKIRNSALVRKVGGVGYYRSSGGPTGFVHIDSGNVRHWGPAISKSQWASIMKEGLKTVGRRVNRKDQVAVASAEMPPEAPEESVESIYDGDQMANLSAGAAQEPEAPAAKPKLVEEPVAAEQEAPKAALTAFGYPVPKPRQKPLEILMMAAANMKIEPASAPPPTQIIRTKPSEVADSLGAVEAAETLVEEPALVEQAPSTSGKGSYAAALRNGTAEEVPLIKPVMASAESTDIDWWPQLLFNPQVTARRDGVPSLSADDSVLSTSAALSSVSQTPAEGKGDMLVVNREGKGALPSLMPLKSANRMKVGQQTTGN